MRRLLLPLVVVLLCAGSSCSPGGHGNEGEGEGEPDNFDDHTERALASVADFEAISADGASSTALKFVITRFLTPQENVRFLESDHYILHDEWWWYRLMNNAQIDGIALAGVDVGRSFDTVQDIVDWARAQPPDSLPLDLTFVQDGTRLYSPLFYSLSLTQSPKVLGIGTILHFDARPEVDPPLAEQWAIELEFSHQVNEEELQHMIDVLTPAMPDGIGAQLKLLVRSQQQEDFAQQLADEGSPLADRILRYSDVTVVGETEVYSEGITAGRLKAVHRGETGLEDTLSTDMLVTEDVPDFLPQCAALITSVPQTALAHVNILAKNRGIPNAYRGGILEDPNVDQLARIRAPVLVRASGDRDLVVQRITEAQFSQYRTLTEIPDNGIIDIPIDGVEIAYDLTDLDFGDEATWRPVLGGKSMGHVALADADDVTNPPNPIGISIVPYVHHIASIRTQLTSMIADPEFDASSAVRLLVLQGADSYLAAHPTDAGFPDSFVARRGAGDPLREFVEAGGVQQVIRDQPMSAADLAAVVTILEDHYSDYADDQALRFRSSSNIEDAEGFNGAGLYTSNSGFLHADLIGEDRTIESAIKETWASYWCSEAFEERRLAKADHLGGSMGIAVHANFPDDIEASNGVATFTLLPPGHPLGRAILEVNEQEGALSVTNPPPGDPNLPEVDRLIDDGDGPSITRVRGSTLLGEGQYTLTDAQLFELFDELDRVTQLWIGTQNAALPASQQRTTLTLDFEMREVKPGWPALQGANQYGARLVVKQARTLEPSLVHVPDLVRSMPFPKDVLARARRVEQRRCEGTNVVFTVTEAVTDPQKLPDMGYTRAPFTSFVVVEWKTANADFGVTAGTRRAVNHTAFTATRPGMEAGGPWAADVVIDAASVATAGFAHATSDGSTVLVENGAAVISEPATCTPLVLHASPEDFLESLIE